METGYSTYQSAEGVHHNVNALVQSGLLKARTHIDVVDRRLKCQRGPDRQHNAYFQLGSHCEPYPPISVLAERNE